MTKLNLTILVCLLLATNFYCTAQGAKSNYKIVNKFSIEGDGGWDYITIDELTGRLFISHSTVTQVVDSKTGKLIKSIPDTKGVHGITLAPAVNKAFISCGKDSTVTIINLSTLDLISKINIQGANPDAILYDKYSNRVFVLTAVHRMLL